MSELKKCPFCGSDQDFVKKPRAVFLCPKGVSPYKAFGDVIETWAKQNYYDDFVVTVWTDTLGETNTLYTMSTPNSWYWENDWYEGGRAELRGFIPVNWIKTPDIEELNMVTDRGYNLQGANNGQ